MTINLFPLFASSRGTGLPRRNGKNLCCNDRILCFLPNKILFLTLLLTVAFQEFRLFSIHSFFYYIYLLTRSYAGLYISCDTANAVMRCMSLFFTLFSATP